MISAWAAMLQAMQQSARDLKEIERTAKGRFPRPARAKPGRPAAFTTYRDPSGKFELAYPTEWELQTGDGVHVRSKRIGTFAGVEVHPASTMPWSDLEAAISKLGGTFEIRKREAGPPRHVQGTMQIGPTRYSWNAYAHDAGKETVTLLVGNVIDSERTPKIERYEDKVLEGIRREFKVTAAPQA